MEIEQSEQIPELHPDVNSQTSEEHNNNIYEWIGIGEDSFMMDASLDFQNYSNQIEFDQSDPLLCFQKLFPESLLDFVVERTNNYAQISIKQEFERLSSNTILTLSLEDFFKSRWKQLDIKEFKSFLGCCFLMGLIEKPDLYDYWATYYLLQTPCFSKIISRNRFLQIMRYLHVSNDKPSIQSHQIPTNNRLLKIADLLNILNDLWRSNYILDKHIVIDESIVDLKED